MISQLSTINSVKGRDPNGTLRSQPSVELHIEELILHGFPSGDRHRIAEAMQRELAHLFTEEQTPSLLSKNAEIDQLNSQAFQTTATPNPETTGAQVARAVFGGLKQ
jgi:hypothetical protein